MKLRGGAYELPELATKVSRCSPTCARVGVQVTLARPPARPKETPAGSPTALDPAAGSQVEAEVSPALTAYAVPSCGVGACQRRLSCGPRVVPAPAPTTATRAVSAARANERSVQVSGHCSQFDPKNGGATRRPPRSVVLGARGSAGERRPAEADSASLLRPLAHALDAMRALAALFALGFRY